MAPIANPKTIARMANATTTVFGVTELCEAILLDLPFPDLLRANAVIRSFHDTIKGSTLIQQKLWFLPSPERKASGVITINPLLTHLLNVKQDGGCIISVHGPDPSNSGQIVCKKTLALNDVALDDAATIDSQDDILIETPRMPNTFCGSWRKMLVADPPIPIFIRVPPVNERIGHSTTMQDLLVDITRAYMRHGRLLLLVEGSNERAKAWKDFAFENRVEFKWWK